MQFRADAGSWAGTLRRVGPGPPLAAPLLRGGFPVDYGPRVEDRRHTVQLPSRQQQQHHPHPPHPRSSQGGDDQEESFPSRHLWVGNVSQEVTECLLVEKFSKFGPLESVTVYSQRNYAFINFRNIENAQDAKNGLQGVVLGGFSMRIEYAKGAKPSRHLWVGGISQTVPKEQIEGEFKRFGAMEDFKLLRDRNCAFVDYEKIEDAIAAVDSLNRKRLGEEELRVDFGRSQPPKRETTGRPGIAASHEEWAAPPNKDARDCPDQYKGAIDPYNGPADGFKQPEKGSSCDSFLGTSDSFQAGSVPGTSAPASGRSRGEKEEPSDVLWVGFPLLSKVDEEGLHRAFAPYGEVERVKTFPGRTYAFVQFKNVEEASRAKVALEGKLFNDPRVHVRFSNSEIGPVVNPRTDGDLISPSRGKEAPGFLEKFIVMTTDRFVPPLRQTGLRPEYYPGGLARGGAFGRAVKTGISMSLGNSVGKVPELTGPQGKIPLAERDQTANQDGRILAGTCATRTGGGPAYDEIWDLPDGEGVGREPKRLRMFNGVGSSPSCNSSFGGRRYSEPDNLGSGSALGRELFGLPSSRNSGSEGSQGGGLPGACLGSVELDRPWHTALSQVLPHCRTTQGLSFGGFFTEVGKRDASSIDGGGTGLNEGWKWHGTIAKGGTPVCRARCLPVGKGIDVTVPDVVNCTARTDLDMLAKHVYQAGDFGVVFFVPEADPDIPPYYDFMHYLGEKHRAGVAKLADGTTLFLVPPSGFSEKVLKVPGNNCLFGVVLKSQSPSSVEHGQFQPQPPAQLHQLPQPVRPQQPATSQQPNPQWQPPAIVNGHSTEDTGVFLGTSPPQQSSSPTAASSTQTQTQMTGMAGSLPLPTALTPELIASLTALLPQQNQSHAPQPVSGSNMLPISARDGKTFGLMGRASYSSGHAIPAPAPIDNWPIHRALKTIQQPMLQSQGRPFAKPEQQSGHMCVPSEQGFVYLPALQQSHALLPRLFLGQGEQGHTGAQSHGFSGPGYGGQQPLQQPRSQTSPSEWGGAPLLPADQLAQLTALLTQRQQQPGQHQQHAAQLLQHEPQQQTALSTLSQQDQQLVPFRSYQTPMQSYSQQPQQYASQTSSQQLWAQGGSLSQHLSQLLGHPEVTSGGHICGWEVAMMSEGHPQAQQPPSTQQNQLQQHQLLQPMPTGVVTAEQSGGANQDEGDRQKRFQATLQLAAALLQQMQHQQTPGSGLTDQ